jgi:type VI protein secretion system component VasF
MRSRFERLHGVHLDDADRASKPHRVPWWLAAGVAVLVLVVLYYLHRIGVNY